MATDTKPDTPRSVECRKEGAPLSEASCSVNALPITVAALKAHAMGNAMRTLTALSAVVFLSACANTGDTRFPSLATRPGERVSGTLAPAPRPAPPPATAATGNRLADLRASALAAHRRFGELRGRAEQLSAAARGAAVASEAWSVAQVALAELEAARSETAVALADLDSLYIAAAAAAVPTAGSGDLDAIGAARAEVTGWMADDDAVLESLKARLQ